MSYPKPTLDKILYEKEDWIVTGSIEWPPCRVIVAHQCRRPELPEGFGWMYTPCWSPPEVLECRASGRCWYCSCHFPEDILTLSTFLSMS